MNVDKTVLTGINASYSHTALSVYALARMPVETELITREFTINEDLPSIFRALLEEQADLYAFSCYIWNIDVVLRVCRMLKTVRPDCTILLGGPEVSEDAAAYLQRHPAIDAILTGEGERSFPLLFTREKAQVPGLWYRDDGEVHSPAVSAPTPVLSELPQVYTDFPFRPNKMYYYEASRGCPYRCAFCLSSETGVRTVPMEQVKQELRQLLAAKVMLVKFVDRTMNADPQRFGEILRFLTENDNGVTGFHMEIHPSALLDAQLNQIAALRDDLVQFEIGVQSTNPETCRAISRAGETAQIHRVITRLREAGNVHLHLDLIAGLPYEDLQSFAESFETVMQMRPHKLQLGFLKLLRGTKLRSQAKTYGMRFAPDAPYEVLRTQWLQPEELFLLKDISDLVDRLYNENRFEKTLLYLKEVAGGWWTLFFEMAKFARKRGDLDAPLSTQQLFALCYEAGVHCGADPVILRELLTFDALVQNRKQPATGFIRPDPWTAADFLATDVQEALAEEDETTGRDWYKRTRAQRFSYQVDRYEGEGVPEKGSVRILFIYKEETSIRRIGKG